MEETDVKAGDQAWASPCSHRKARYRHDRFLIVRRRIVSCKCGYRHTRFYIEFKKEGKK